MFSDLGNLSKLNLSGNIFSTLTTGLFTHLVALKVLHFSTDTLFCDCQLKWLLLWARRRSVRIGNDTLCVFPNRLHGLEFRSLREQQLSCDGPLEMPLFQLIPSQRQLVFRGDRLPLQCTASRLDSSVELRWRHNGHVVTTQEDRGIYVEETLLHDCCLLTSEVVLSNIDVAVAGVWECLVTSSRGNASQHMEIVVVETSAPYCPADRVTNNKGDFRWPKTLAGILAFQPCAPATFGSAPHPSGGGGGGGAPPHAPGQREKKAWRSCDRTGRWAEEDYTQCPYASESTRVLHELTQIPINVTNAQPLGQQLVAFTSRAAHFTDVMDVIFVTHLVERLTRLVGKRKDLGDYISDIASNMMLVEEHILWMAQNEARACTRIVQCVERIADLALTGDNQVISKVSANIALEAFLIRPSNFLGLSCTALQRPSAPLASSPLTGGHSQPDKETAGESLLNFKCHTVNNSGSPASQLSKPLPSSSADSRRLFPKVEFSSGESSAIRLHLPTPHHAPTHPVFLLHGLPPGLVGRAALASQRPRGDHAGDRGIYVEETLLHDCCLLTSEVVLSNIDVAVAGVWECLVTSSRGNASQHMEIVVVETSAPYCPADRVTNNKGDFRWPKTLAGILAFQPCAPATLAPPPTRQAAAAAEALPLTRRARGRRSLQVFADLCM
ncbi:adhesion G protein-coupled receptor A2-like [Salarias fasciatus]|uniref:adhesion G protein-coupled receptor A2-like n=1 Tax=Salarias fasciatus TaxID=181472 RepID=UPI001176EFAC|nr:adhesion G protein-coupled receptor A2-like [Salarias fasciatus]